MDASDLPRWRGFNLTEKFTMEAQEPFREEHFAWLSEWGFDFARLPMDYRCWVEDDDRTAFREDVLAEIDEAVRYGRRHGVHVSLNFHRIPGYCINRQELEPYDLWTDEEALEAAAEHWRRFAARYDDVPSEELSFNLLNEPHRTTHDRYERVARRLVDAIRSEDPDRLIIADGLGAGREPLPELADLDVAQGTRGYEPMEVSHYQAGWIDAGEDWPEPAWPLDADDGWDRERLREECIEPWQALEDRGVGVHVGEFGAYNETPHGVAIDWLREYLELWEEAGWGWALWNLEGAFGVLDSGRDDVDYEEWRGHDLDRELLELLRAH